MHFYAIEIMLGKEEIL